MSPNTSRTSILRRIAAKEVTLFFASPIAYLFLGSFLAVTLFIVFWGETFFARNIADVRPMFTWMPVLLIILCSALTMRLWSEERRTGTLEHVLTQPVPLWVFVLGKFLGCLNLLGTALILTLPLPITVSLMGHLDWGPVFAGYLATFLLGAAYLAIGLFVSARSSNQIVSLLCSIGICGLFYLMGTPILTDLLNTTGAEFLRQLGTGSRFEAIERGIINLADLAYYFSLTVAFLTLNALTLEHERWSRHSQDTPLHRRWQLTTALILANALVLNLWLGQTKALRFDVTAGQQYTISTATTTYLAGLQEPLLIRGYFSGKTHPLLAPLIPKLKDLITEYGIAGGSKVRVEFVDPTSDSKVEEEAAQDYGIKPVPFQVADRYQAAIVSSYFSILIKYGSEYKVLGFQDLIEVKASSPQNVQVNLRNPEYDLTRAIKKLVDSYQAQGDIFNRVEGKLTLTAYVSEDGRLPAPLLDTKKALKTAANKLVQESNSKLSFLEVDPDAQGGKVATKLKTDYGLQPMAVDPTSPATFYFYVLLERKGQVVAVPIDDGKEATLERNLKTAVKHFATGFTKNIALVTPTPDQPFNPYGGPPPGDFQQLEQYLGTEYTVEKEDLNDGSVAPQADILLLAAPKSLNTKALFAVDQFLMQGGTVLAMTSPYHSNLSESGLSMKEESSGLEDWLSKYGLTIDKKLVMDPQNTALAIPVSRNIGGMPVQDIAMLDYPYFIDIRPDGFTPSQPITADLPQITLAWPSPITLDEKKLKGRQVTELLHSTPKSWLSSSTDITPAFDDSGQSHYTPTGEQKAHLLAAVVTGRFDSSFSGQSNPLLSESDHKSPHASGFIGHSPDSAKLIVIASNDALSDTALRLESSAGGSQYLNTLQMVANAIDWATEDTSLLSIRSRGHYNHTLHPMKPKTEMIWEGLNYLLALIGLGLVALFRRLHQRHRLTTFQAMVGE